MSEEWRNRVAAMRADEDFMAWLKEYAPDWECEYSGNLLGMHDAFRAGAARAARH